MPKPVPNLPSVPDQKPTAPEKLATEEQLFRYLTTVSKMLHRGEITPQEANAQSKILFGKIDRLRQSKQDNKQVVINIGLPMGSAGTIKMKKGTQETEEETISIEELDIEVTEATEELAPIEIIESEED
nr:hypothetical protein 4 [Desulfobulbaceae bacterium]